jgi:surface antigen
LCFLARRLLFAVEGLAADRPQSAGGYVPAVSLRSCIVVAAAFAILSGCASVDTEGEAKDQETPTAAVPESAAAPAELPAAQSAGLGPVALLGPAGSGTEPKPNANAVGGRVFNGAYAVELGAVDRRRAREAIHTALEWLPVGRLKVWRNPDNGHWGTVTATRTYQDAKGAWCREYSQTVTLGGDENQESGVACRGIDGAWRPVG